jgi:6-phospho-beta-glucosidase
MRVVIIGGSSFSTPSLIQFLDSNETPEKIEVVLAGRSREKLAAVARASRLLVKAGVALRTKPIGPNNWRDILDGADNVVIQVRVGGFEGRLLDETFPNKYGLCGDEGLGAGGLSAGWRTWSTLATILDAIVKFCPKAFVILLTSPLSSLVRAALQHADLNLVGICELPWTTMQGLSNILGLHTSEIQGDDLGVNHHGWFFNIRSGLRDLTNTLVDELAKSKRSFPSSEFLRKEGCFPTRYLRMHYEPDKVVAEQTSEQWRRAQVLSDIQNQSHQIYRSGKLSEIVSVLEGRATPWYSQAVGPLLLALCGQKVEIPFFLSARNDDYVPFLAPGDVVECQYHWANVGLQRLPLTSAPPKHVVENLVPFVEFERAATEAMMSRSVPGLKNALALHPWVDDHFELQSMIDELVTANAALMAGSGGRR